MTGILASVTSVVEADIVMQAGVDIIDIKDPASGALGAQPVGVVTEIINRVDGKVPVSATVGDIKPGDPLLPAYIESMATTGVDIVKVGLFNKQPDGDFLKHMAKAVADDVNIVVVLFAEYAPLQASLPALLETGIHGLMIDTAIKNGQSLRDHLDDRTLDKFVRAVQAGGAIAGLAGSLRQADIPSLLATEPDYLGFRGALCRSRNRTNQLDDGLVIKVRNAVHIDKDFEFDNVTIQQAS